MPPEKVLGPRFHAPVGHALGRRGRLLLATGLSSRLCIVILALGAFGAPLAANAQQAGKVHRVGVLTPATPAAAAHLFEAFNKGLREHGYVEGQNVIVERRYGEARAERLPDLAAELVRAKVDVIVTPTDLAVQAARQHTRTIPIVMVSSLDPVGTGFVQSLARPGGNITGLSVISPELSGKRLQLLKETVPKVSRVAFLWNPDVTGAALDYKEIETAARLLKLDILALEVRRVEGLDSALAAITRERANALTLNQNPVTFTNRSKMVTFAAKSRLPAMYNTREYVDAGGLMAYGPNNPDLWRRAATYVDKILKGAKPAHLPVEQPTRFELVLNMKTAKALGITFPQTILIRADQVVQ